MSAINNFNVLPFYTSLSKQNSKKWYSFGNVYPLASPKDKILPFQIVMASIVSTVSSITIHNQKTGATTSSGLTPTIFTPEGSNYSIVYLKLSSISSLQEGRYYLSFNIDGITMYSEIFNAIGDLSEYVKLEYWNEDDLYNRDKIQVYFGDDFRFTMYICTDIGKPEYIFEEELTKRLGYKFLESQISNKLYKFTFLAPEYMTDSMRIIRLCDFIKLTQSNEEYNALNFAYDAKWEQQGDLASVECEFETDTIIQKLQSFNRRQQQSFYNALLSNIDEPILFDTEVVAQYYADFQTGGLIQGKLIHELELETELKPGAFIPIDNNDGTPAKKISVTALTSSSHTHANKEFLDVIDQGLSKDSSVEFKNIKSPGYITAGAANNIPPDDLPIATDLLYGVVKIDGTTIKINLETGAIYVDGGTGGVSSWNDLTDKPANLIAIAALTGAGLIRRNSDGTFILDNSAFLTAITKEMVENVLTGIITSHQHNYLPISGGNLTGPLTILTNTVWHAGNSNKNDVDWTVRELIADTYALHTSPTNPYLKMVLNGLNWYVQLYQDKLYMGYDIANSIEVDQTGNTKIPGNVTVEGLYSSGPVVAGATNGVLPDDLPVATDLLYGVVKIDDVTIKIDANGKIYAIATGGVSSWNDLTDKPANLTALAALTGAGIVRRNSDGSFSIDTSVYLTAITKAMVENVLTGNISTHSHSQYLTAITKTMVENVLTGNITSHTHSQYLTAITKTMVENVLTGNITSHTHSQYLLASSYTASDVLSKILTVDSAGSGLDSDTLDTYHETAFPRIISTSNNLNNLTRTGMYIIFDGAYNIPSGATALGAHVVHYNWDANAAVQMYYNWADDRVWTRRKIGSSVWNGWILLWNSSNSNLKTVDWSAKDLKCVNTFADGAVVAGALNGTLPNDLPVATSAVFGVVKTGASINNNAGVVNINGRHYTTTSTYTDAAVREITAEIALGTGSMANGTLDQIQLSFAPLTTTRGLTANVIATNTGAGMGLKLSFCKDTGTGRWYIMIYNDSGASVTRDGILLSIRGQQTI